jgi:hypothetical protein
MHFFVYHYVHLYLLECSWHCTMWILLHKAGLLSKQDCFRSRTAFEAGLLSKQDCFRSRTAFEAGLLSKQDCFRIFMFYVRAIVLGRATNERILAV